MTKTISRLFDDYADAKTAVAELERLGVPHSDLSIVANNAHGTHGATSHDHGSHDHDDHVGLTRAEAGGAGAIRGQLKSRSSLRWSRSFHALK